MNPWDDVPAFKDEKAFLNWLRSQSRRIWSRHPTKLAYKQSRRYKAPVGRNNKDVWVSDCEICGCQSRNCEVDHLSAGGSFHDWDSYTLWLKRILWVSFEDIRELCPSCHSIVTYSQVNNLSWDEAVKYKKIIEKLDKPAKEQQKELTSLGFDSKMTSNAEKRKQCYLEAFERGDL